MTIGTFLVYLWGFGMLAAGIGLWIYVLADWVRWMIRESRESKAETEISD